MALDKSILTKALLANIPNPTDTQKKQVQSFADAIYAFVKSADVIYQSNLTSATGGAVSAVLPTNSIAQLK